MFLTKRWHRELLAEQRERFEAQLVEKERVVTVLVEQLEYLRILLGRPLLTPQMALNPSDQPEILMGITSPYMSEMEEEIEHHRKSGRLTEEQAEEAMKEFGATPDFEH